MKSIAVLSQLVLLSLTWSTVFSTLEDLGIKEVDIKKVEEVPVVAAVVDVEKVAVDPVDKVVVDETVKDKVEDVTVKETEKTKVVVDPEEDVEVKEEKKTEVAEDPGASVAVSEEKVDKTSEVDAFETDGFSMHELKLCSSIMDCSWDECCVARKWLNFMGMGVCRKREAEGHRCIAAPGWHNMKMYGKRYFRRCPCKNGFYCVTLKNGKLIRSTSNYKNNICLSSKTVSGYNSHYSYSWKWSSSST